MKTVFVFVVVMSFALSGCQLEMVEDATDLAAGDVAEDTTAEVFDPIPMAPDTNMYDIQAPPVPDWNADEKCAQYINNWECSCKSGACCPGCEHHWKTIIKSSGDETAWFLSVTDVTEVDSQTYEVVCKSGMDELDFENGKLYAISNPTDPATKKVFECVPAEQ